MTRVILIGDSLTVGRGAGWDSEGVANLRPHSPANILARALTTLGTGTSAHSIVGLGSHDSIDKVSAADLRIDTANWKRLPKPTAIGGDTFYADDNQAGRLTFNFGNVDTIMLGLPNSTTGAYGTLRWRLDGGTWVTHNEATANPACLDRVPVLVGGTLGPHVVEIESTETTTNTFVQYCEAWDSADDVVLIPWGSRGAKSSDVIATAQAWSWIPALSAVPFDAVIVGIGMNDISTTVTRTAFEANVTTLVNAIRSANPTAPIILTIPLERDGGLGYLPTALAYLATTLGCTLIDLRATPGLGTYGDAVLAGAMYDRIHPNKEGFENAWTYAAPTILGAIT